MLVPDAATDDNLLKRALSGDETAFQVLYERHWGVVYRFAYRVVGSVETAEDITHDCFVSLLNNPDRYNSELAALGTYLCAAARNLAFKHLRRTGNRISDEDFEPEAISTDGRPGPLHDLLSAELSASVRRAIAELPVLQREALVLFEYEELSLAEVASVVGADVGTVKSRLSRARERLRKVFAPYFGASEGKGRETVQ